MKHVNGKRSEGLARSRKQISAVLMVMLFLTGCGKKGDSEGDSTMQVSEKQYYLEIIPVLQQQLEHTLQLHDEGRVGTLTITADRMRLLAAQGRARAIDEAQYERDMKSYEADIVALIRSAEESGSIAQRDASEIRLWLAWMRAGSGILPPLPKFQR
jgi:hypothetical protein